VDDANDVDFDDVTVDEAVDKVEQNKNYNFGVGEWVDFELISEIVPGLV